MTPIGSSTTGTAWFLDGLANLQQQQLQTQRQLSSGYRVQDASDSPSQTPELVQLGSALARVQAYQTNLGDVQTEAKSGDDALASSILLIQSARTLAQQGAGSTSSAADRLNLASAVQSIQEQIVSNANTETGGNYIFGGDQNQSPPYRFDASSANGVDSLTTQTGSRVIVDPEGQPVYRGLTGDQVFNPTDATGAPTASNAFSALQSLRTALLANDPAGAASALGSLESAASWLGLQQASYGTAGQKIANEQNDAASRVTSLKVQIGNIRDTDVAQAATDLAHETTSQAAAMGAQSEISRKTLFDYLG